MRTGTFHDSAIAATAIGVCVIVRAAQARTALVCRAPWERTTPIVRGIRRNRLIISHIQGFGGGLCLTSARPLVQ